MSIFTSDSRRPTRWFPRGGIASSRPKFRLPKAGLRILSRCMLRRPVRIHWSNRSFYITTSSGSTSRSIWSNRPLDATARCPAEAPRTRSRRMWLCRSRRPAVDSITNCRAALWSRSKTSSTAHARPSMRCGTSATCPATATESPCRRWIRCWWNTAGCDPASCPSTAATSESSSGSCNTRTTAACISFC